MKTKMAILLATLAVSSTQLVYAQCFNEGATLIEIDNFLQENPTSIYRQDALMAKGNYFFNREDWAEALKIYDRLDARSFAGKSGESLKEKTAYCLIKLGENERAKSLLAGLNTENAKFYRAYLDYEEGNLDEALRGFEAVLPKAELAKWVPYYEAQIYFAQGDYNQALERAQGCLNTIPTPEKYQLDRVIGESLYNQGKMDEGLNNLWEYCANVQNPLPSAYYILGVSEFQKGNTDASIKLLQQAIGSHNAMEQSAYLLLGQAYRKRGEPTQAMMAFENAYKVDYDSKVRETAFYNYAVALSQGGKVPFARSASLLEEFLREYPRSQYSTEARDYVISSLMSDNDYEKALEILNAAKTHGAKDVQERTRVLLVLGSRALKSNNVGKAYELLTEAVKANGPAEMTSQAHLWLAETCYKMGNYKQAAQEGAEALKDTQMTSENKALANYYRGYALYAQESYKGALTSFKNAISLALEPKVKADALNRAADCEYYLKNFKQAENYYAQAIKEDKENGDYPMFQTAMMQGLQKNYKQKISTLNSLRTQYPNSGLLPNAMLEKAQTHAALQASKEAIDDYLELITLYPQTAQSRQAYLQLAITQLNQGKTEQAINTYEEVISAYPTSSEARIAVADLKELFAREGRIGEIAQFLKSVPDAPQLSPSEMETLSFNAAEQAYAKKGETKLLEAYLEEYPKGGDRSTTLFYLGESAYNAGNPTKAEKYLQELTTNYPDASATENALLLLGETYQNLRKSEQALSTFTQAETKASTPENLNQARLGIMNAAIDLKDFNRVIETAKKINPLSSESAQAYAEALIATKQFKEAYQVLSALESDLSSEIGAKAAMTHANALWENGKTSEAKKLVEKIISSNTPQAYYLAKAFILYSDILKKEGKNFEAKEYLKSLKSNYPGQEEEIFEMIDKRLKN